jgi:hypothetical protein
MKQILIVGFLCFLLSSCGQSAGSDNSSSAEAPANEAKVQVYYFYGKMRCETCITLQEVAHDAIMENFADNKDVAFHEIDFSQGANAALAEKYEVVFSSLIIADENEYKDITDQSFAMVLGDPDGLKALIAAETNEFLKN